MLTGVRPSDRYAQLMRRATRAHRKPEARPTGWRAAALQRYQLRQERNTKTATLRKRLRGWYLRVVH